MFLQDFFSFFFPRRCVLCHMPLSSQNAVCNDCARWVLAQKPMIRRQNGKLFSVSAFAYEGNARGALQRFKFYHQDYQAKTLAEWMTLALCQSVSEPFDLATWVPVGFFRNWRRGYDQGKLLCREVAKLEGIEMMRCLVKRYDNRKQSSVRGADRWKNIENVYRTCRNLNLHGKRVLLIDDVTTTGATLRKCAALLRRAGATEVVCLTFAATR